MTASIEWLRSERCDTGTCVEVARWISARCESGNCVEVADFAGDVVIRDSKLGEASPVLRFTWAEWRAFVDGIAALDASLGSSVPSEA